MWFLFLLGGGVKSKIYDHKRLYHKCRYRLVICNQLFKKQFPLCLPNRKEVPTFELLFTMWAMNKFIFLLFYFARTK